MKIVTPFRAFAPESASHKKLGAFDWPGAITMLRASAAKACQCETHVITDVDAVDLPGPVHFFETTERRLMLWVLDVALCYLRSDAFDQDTVMVSPDMLVFGDLRPFFCADLGVVVRTSAKFAAKPEKQVLNGAQWWRVSARERLVAFYARALGIARALPESRKVWGGDTDPLVELLAPIRAGHQPRAGLDCYGHELGTVMGSLSRLDEANLDAGRRPSTPVQVLVDFKCGRKLYQRRYFDLMVGSAVPA